MFQTSSNPVNTVLVSVALENDSHPGDTDDSMLMDSSGGMGQMLSHDVDNGNQLQTLALDNDHGNDNGKTELIM